MKWTLYYWSATIVAYLAAAHIVPRPSSPDHELSPIENVVSSLIVSVSLGWIIWPFLLVAVRRQRSEQREEEESNV